MNERETISRWVDARRDDLLTLLKNLIAAKTENPPGNEIAAAKVMEAFFDSHGIPSECYEEDPGRTNIIGTIGEGGKSLLLPGHLDTVPAGDGWTVPPFQATIRNGRVYGRGAADNKGPLAAVAMAGACLRECFKLRGRVFVGGMADEEKGSKLGAEYVLREKKVKADFALVPDVAGNMREVHIAEKGLFFVEIISHGKQAHGSTPQKGINALWNLIALLNRVRESGVPQARHALLSPPTCNLGMMSGGAAANIVPGKASAVLDIRYLPGQSVEQMMQWLESLMRETEKEIAGASFEIRTKSMLPPTEVSADNELVKVIQETATEFLEAPPKLCGMPGATVSKQLLAYGTTAVGFAPGDSDQAHIADESISIEELVTFSKITAMIAVRLLGAD